jgi:hypothetical protein
MAQAKKDQSRTRKIYPIEILFLTSRAASKYLKTREKTTIEILLTTVLREWSNVFYDFLSVFYLIFSSLL